MPYLDHHITHHPFPTATIVAGHASGTGGHLQVGGVVVGHILETCLGTGTFMPCVQQHLPTPLPCHPTTLPLKDCV